MLLSRSCAHTFCTVRSSIQPLQRPCCRPSAQVSPPQDDRVKPASSRSTFCCPITSHLLPSHWGLRRVSDASSFCQAHMRLCWIFSLMEQTIASVTRVSYANCCYCHSIPSHLPTSKHKYSHSTNPRPDSFALQNTNPHSNTYQLLPPSSLTPDTNTTPLPIPISSHSTHIPPTHIHHNGSFEVNLHQEGLWRWRHVQLHCQGQAY